MYLFINEREREGGRDRQREKQAPCREPDARLDPGSPGSHPKLKVALNRWATRAAQQFFKVNSMPNVRLDPGSPGSHPGLKVALNR